MRKTLSEEQRRLLSILEHALTGRAAETAPSALTAAQWEQVFQIAGSHAVLPLLYDVLEQERTIPPHLLAQAQYQSRQTALQNYRLLYLTNYLVKLLQKEAVSVVVLKGAATAGLYPVPELRKSGDVDLLVFGKEDFVKTRGILEKNGFLCKETQVSNHHVVFQSRHGIEVEIHTALTEPFDDRQVNRYLEALSDAYGRNTREQEVLGSRLPVPTDAYHAFYLLLHMLQHFLRTGFGLKLLCDWVVFWNRDVAEPEVSTFLQLVEEIGLSGFLERVTAVCVCYLGLRAEKVPFADPALTAEAAVEEMMLEILEAEEFGKSGNDRMVVMRGTSPSDYVREFHHQMCLNNPNARKIVLLWPVLWVGTLVRFLYNNRKIRKISAFSILRKAKARSRNQKELRLFQGARCRNDAHKP